MKKLIFFVIFGLITLLSYSQIDSVMIFDISETTIDTVQHYYDVAGLSTTRGALHMQFRFDSLDCDGSALLFDAGTAFKENRPASYPVSYSELSFPLPLDTTSVRPAPNDNQLLFCRYPLNGDRPWNFMLKFNHDRGWIVYTLVNTNPTGCTKGYIWRYR